MRPADNQSRNLYVAPGARFIVTRYTDQFRGPMLQFSMLDASRNVQTAVFEFAVGWQMLIGILDLVQQDAVRLGMVAKNTTESKSWWHGFGRKA